MTPTFIQKRISPFMSAVFGRFFIDRRQMAFELAKLSRFSSVTEKKFVQERLREKGIIQPKFSTLPMESLEHFHLQKTLTLNKLMIISHEIDSPEFRELVHAVLVSKKRNIRLRVDPLERAKASIIRELAVKTRAQAGLHKEIMTPEMNKRNNDEKAAHWKYKLQLMLPEQVFEEKSGLLLTGNFATDFYTILKHCV